MVRKAGDLGEGPFKHITWTDCQDLANAVQFDIIVCEVTEEMILARLFVIHANELHTLVKEV